MSRYDKPRQASETAAKESKDMPEPVAVLITPADRKRLKEAMDRFGVEKARAVMLKLYGLATDADMGELTDWQVADALRHFDPNARPV